jgi:hypothetical protein
MYIYMCIHMIKGLRKGPLDPYIYKYIHIYPYIYIYIHICDIYVYIYIYIDVHIGPEEGSLGPVAFRAKNAHHAEKIICVYIYIYISIYIKYMYTYV